METIKLPFFGKISINKNLHEQDFNACKKVNENFVDFNLNFVPLETKFSNLEIVKSFLEDFQGYVNKATKAITKDYEHNGMTKEFVQIFESALSPLLKEVLLETLAKGRSLEDYLFEDIELDQVYIFPDDENEFIKFNYQISKELDEFLFVRFDKDCKIVEIGIEY